MSENIDTPTPPADNAGSQPNDILEPQGAMTVPPPVPRREPGFFRRLFMSRRKRQSLAVQNGYLEMVDLIRAIRSHLDRQETVQTRVLTMLEKVPDTMERQHEVMSLFKQQLENSMENDRRLTDSMGRLSGTLDTMNDSQKASSRTITDLIGRSRETEQLLREVMRRAERRMTFLIVFFILLVIGVGFYLIYWQNRPTAATLQPDPSVATVTLDQAEESPASVSEEPATATEPDVVTELEPALVPDAATEPDVEAEPDAVTEPDLAAKPEVAAEPDPALATDTATEPTAAPEPAETDPLPENLPPVENAPAATRAEAKDTSDDSAPPAEPQATKKKKRAPSRSKATSKSKPAAAKTPPPPAEPMTEATPDFVLSPDLPLTPEAADLTLAPLQEALDEAADQPAVVTPVSLP